MRYYQFANQKTGRGALWIALLALLLLTRDAMYSMMVWDFYTCQFLTLGIIAVLGIAFLIVNRSQLKAIFRDPRMALIALALITALLPMAVKQDWQLMYFSIILGLLFAVFISYFVTLKETARWYVVTMCGLGIWSILTAYILRLPQDMGIVSMSPVTNNNGVEFFNFVFSIVPDTFVKNRNFGFCREPGVYQFFILIALYLNNDVLHWDSEKKFWAVNIILGATMLSTFATGGMIELCLLFAIFFLEKKWYRNKWILMGLALVFVMAAVAAAYLVAVKNEMYFTMLDMVAKFTRNPESVGSRLGSITHGVTLFFQKPLVGERVTTVLHTMVDYSASTLILYNIFGILGGTLNVVGWIALAWRKQRNIVLNILVLAALFMSFNTQNLTWNLFFWLFPGLALAERGIPLVCALCSARKRKTNQ